MLSSAPSTCLRCRLRETIRTLQLQRQSRHSLFRSPRNARDITDGSPDNWERREQKKDIIWKHYNQHGEGKIVGKPGRRQRAVAAKLSTKFLDQRVSPSQIIVFQDVKDDPPVVSRTEPPLSPVTGPSTHRILSAQEIADAITARKLPPEAAEVNASIDDLRPSHTVVDDKKHEELKTGLHNGYTLSQLHAYLTTYIPEAAANNPRRGAARTGDGVKQLATSQWRHGRTSLATRHKGVVTETRLNSKLGVIEQILRLVWNVTVESEVERVGELEFKIQPWQMSVLFDLQTRGGKPYFERLITPPLLLETSQVHPYRPDNIIRIVGRRQIAEEVARQLKLIILRIKRTELDLSPFSASVAGDTKKAESMFDEEELQFVSDATKCIVTSIGPGRLSICSDNSTSRRNAQRTLLSLLGLPPVRSFDEISTLGLSSESSRTKSASKTSVKTDADLPEFGLHMRYRQLALTRMAAPTPNVRHPLARTTSREIGKKDSTMPSVAEKDESQDSGSTADSATEDSAIARLLQQQLEGTKASTNGVELWPNDPNTYWRNEVRLSDWEAEFCRLLRDDIGSTPQRRGRKAANAGTRPVNGEQLQKVVTGHETVLSYFEPRALPRPLNLQMGERREKTTFDRRLPFLDAHFVPCPSSSSSAKRLPRIVMRFRISAPTSSGQPRDIVLLGIRAKIDEQRLIVPLPDQSTDISFVRTSSMIARPGVALREDSIGDFFSKLKQSVQYGEGVLDAPPEVTFRLPSFLAKDKKGADAGDEQQVEVRYMFERFEQVQSIEFAPPSFSRSGIDDEVADLMKELDSDGYLDYREVDGGAVYGNSTQLSLRLEQRPASSKRPDGSVDDVASTVSKESAADDSASQSDAVAQNETSEDPSGHEPLDTVDQNLQRSSKEDGGAHADERSSEPMSDVGEVEGDAKSSDLPANASSASLVAAALRIARLLTRATSGSLQRFGGR